MISLILVASNLFVGEVMVCLIVKLAFLAYPDQIMQNSVIVLQKGGLWTQSVEPKFVKSTNPHLCRAVQESKNCPVAVQEDKAFLKKLSCLFSPALVSAPFSY